THRGNVLRCGCVAVPQRFDILGVVIHRLELHETGNIDTEATLEAMPLEFICLSQSHTGEYLAETVRLVVEKFGIQQKICGIVSDNASNNKVMVNELKKLKWTRFRGEAQWVRCFAHVLNLIVQSILRPFGAQKKAKSSQNPTTTDPDGSDTLESSDNDNAALQIRPFTREIDDQSDEEDIGSERDSINGQDSDDTESLSLDDIDNASNEDDDDRYTSDCCRRSLAKFCAVAKKLRYSPNSKAHFPNICAEMGSSSGSVINGMVSDRLANIVMFIDQITEHLSTAISCSKYPPALRNACRLGLKITNKYYSLTNTSPLYRIAIVLHPSFRDKYFKSAKWEPEWIAKAIRLTRDMWVTFYKPEPPNSTPVASLTVNAITSKPRNSMLAGLGSAAAA
ncbi:hypothetical protein PTTG_29279, partial [Puccinia triticina 1-1 BBBD Race 1]